MARAANKAFREGRPLRAADVDARAWVPELRVLVGARPVTEGGRLLALAAPKSARLTLGAGEVGPTRMDAGTEKQSVSVEGAPAREMTGGVLRVVFEREGPGPPWRRARGPLRLDARRAASRRSSSACRSTSARRAGSD